MSRLQESELELSETVVNSAMNRARGLAGVNSYARELRLDVSAWLLARVATHGGVAWLDVCCGEGHALRDAARVLQDAGATSVTLVGLDLLPPRVATDRVAFVQASAHSWQPPRAFDLVTCVHGLHYVGDKLGLLERIAGWLASDGLFLGHLDLDDIRVTAGEGRSRSIATLVRGRGLSYSRSTRILRIEGKADLDFGLRFQGAEDHVGPNYTGQPSVRSFYGVPSDGQRPNP